MRKHIAVKILAALLCVLALLGLAFSGLGILMLQSQNLYREDPTRRLESLTEAKRNWYADDLAYAYQRSFLTELPENWKREDFNFGGQSFQQLLEAPGMGTEIFFSLTDENGKILFSNLEMEKTQGTASETVRESTYTYSLGRQRYVPAEEEIPPTQPGQTEAELQETEPGKPDWVTRYSLETSQGEFWIYEYPARPYTLTLRAADSAFSPWSGEEGEELIAALTRLYPYRFTLIAAAAGLGLAVIGLLSYLGWASGRSPRDREIHLVGLNRLPLDLYLTGAGLVILGLAFFSVSFLERLLWELPDEAQIREALAVTAVCTLTGGGIGILFFCGLTAQAKLPGGYWFRHTVLGWLLGKLWKGICFCGRFLGKLLRMLPVIWQWMAVGGGMLLLTLIGAACFYANAVPMVVVLILSTGLVLYVGYALGTVYSGICRMAAGRLDQPVNGKFLAGCFRDMGEKLNSLADVAVVAAREQMKSERMRAELITNVSHDIKTPLTSIINYADLLQAAQTEEDRQKCLEVLTRQSHRMKKLLEDLIEMSKASSGSIQTDIQKMDAAEAVTQALGEYGDKLEQAGLLPVFAVPEAPVWAMADGRLLWRVLGNLLGNAVKYALPGTRLYLDVGRTGDTVEISVKNISRDPLNISADELMERFVRGDASRNTEGSGLGLNIAGSLMELQHGRLELSVDGDLFKAVLRLPGA